MSAARSFLLLLIICLLSGSALRAQITVNPYFSGQGILPVLQAARQELAADAVLVLIAAAGNTDYDTGNGIIQLRFDTAMGRSTVWAYLCYSPSLKSRMMLVGVDIPGSGMQAFPSESPFPVPADLTVPVKTDLPFASSSVLPARLNADSVYARYRADFPSALPQTLAYTWMAADDSAMLPPSFPRSSPIWSIRYEGEGDSSMVCRVSAQTGAVECMRAAAASVPVVAESASVPRIIASPNPGGGRVSVSVELPRGGDVSMALYDIAGRLLLHPAATTVSGRVMTAEFDLTGLPAGRYYCRAVRPGWVGSVAVVRE